uniref:Uncharacterized protein n=1 Tax=Brassica oleracea var. oleracea TaxID=109376 RepID=A0A0D3A7Y9_BRAOL
MCGCLMMSVRAKGVEIGLEKLECDKRVCSCIGVLHGVLGDIRVYLELKRGVRVIIGRSRALGATFPERHRQVALTCLIRATLPERRGEVARVFIARRHENGPRATSRSDPSRSLLKPGATSRSDLSEQLLE